jgi:hypothetical protein
MRFKAYYQELVHPHFQADFPGLVSYGRFVEWMPSARRYRIAYVRSFLLRGVAASALWIRPAWRSATTVGSHNISVFENLAARGKTSVDWF